MLSSSWHSISRHVAAASLFLAVLLTPRLASAQAKQTPKPAQAPAAPAEVRPRIRAITAFINLDPTQYQQQVGEALTMLHRARTIFESRGYEVETIRIATQPFPEYTKGMTTEQARQAIEAQLKIVLKEPKVLVALAQWYSGTRPQRRKTGPPPRLASVASVARATG